MAKTTGIGSGSKTGLVKNVGYNSTPSQYYAMPKKKVNTQIAKLRTGEILQGKILEIINDSLAKVGLPIGNFNAELHSKLKKGDSLFFLVKALEPSLTLKVHSVSSVQNGNKIPVEEALRMLDIPESELNIKITDWVIRHESKVNREIVLLTASTLKELPLDALKDKNPESVIKLIFNQIHSEDNLNVELFEKLYPLFKKMDEHDKNFDALFNDIIKSKNITLFKSITQISDIKSFNGIVQLNQNVSHNDLLSFLTSQEVFSKLSDNAKSNVFEYSDLVNAIAMWNSMAVQNNLAMYYFLPMLWAGTFYAALITIKKQRHKNRFKTGRDDAESELLEFDDSLKLTGMLGNLFDGSGDIRTFLSNFAMQLRHRLLSLNYDMSSFKFPIDGEEEEMLNNKSTNSPINFTIVV